MRGSAGLPVMTVVLIASAALVVGAVTTATIARSMAPRDRSSEVEELKKRLLQLESERANVARMAPAPVAPPRVEPIAAAPAVVLERPQSSVTTPPAMPLAAAPVPTNPPPPVVPSSPSVPAPSAYEAEQAVADAKTGVESCELAVKEAKTELSSINVKLSAARTKETIIEGEVKSWQSKAARAQKEHRSPPPRTYTEGDLKNARAALDELQIEMGHVTGKIRDREAELTKARKTLKDAERALATLRGTP